MTKVFDTSTLKGLQQAERYKARLENTFCRVTVKPIGLDRVQISGDNGDHLWTGANFVPGISNR